MIRTQIYLPQSQIKYLKDLAHANETTMSGEIRKAIELVNKTAKKKNLKHLKSPR